MRKLVAVFLFAALTALVSDALAVTMDWSPVGDPGNANDPATGSLYGAVPYAYNIGTKDVTVSQYVEFLNAKDPSGANTLGLYNGSMSSATFGGINFNNGNLPGSKYSVIGGRGDHPVVFTTWFDTVRFANWLNNGQGSGDTESGAYTLQGGTPTPSNANSVVRQAGATVFLPSENEWYKAAYYNPVNHSYSLYGTSSSSTPTATGPTATPNSANYANAVGTMTNVGAYTGTTSFYGAFDMGGNVYQWNEALIGLFRGVRGGAFDSFAFPLQSANRSFFLPANELSDVGFRVAMVPEPSSFILAGLGVIGLVAWGWRKRRA